MRTLALRFSDVYAPHTGTISEHEKIIEKIGYVWYGKIGNKISKKNLSSIFNNGPTKILLIKAASSDRYWATVEEYSYEKQSAHPDYYKQDKDRMNTWFKIIKLEKADPDILDKCYIPSTGNRLSDIYKKSMGSYFNIDVAL